MKRPLRGWLCLLALMVLAGTVTSTPLGQDEKPKNPFGLSSEPNPEDADAKAFAKVAKLSGDANDENATQWVQQVTEGKAGTLDGKWSGRWRFNRDDLPWVPQTDLTKFATVGNRVYILFKYHEGSYLIVAVKEGKNRLVGKYAGVDQPQDNGAYVGLIVDNERIDGAWKGASGEGRWDFRRKLK